MREFKIEKAWPSCVNFPVSNIHKKLLSGTVIEPPEIIKIREEKKLAIVKQKLAQIEEEINGLPSASETIRPA